VIAGAVPSTNDILVEPKGRNFTFNLLSSNENQDDGEAEDIQETAEAAFAASSQVI
jgi:hypothetical protein